MTFAEAAMIMMSGGGANIQPLTVTQNGRYDAPAGVDGFNPVVVNVPSGGEEDGIWSVLQDRSPLIVITLSPNVLFFVHEMGDVIGASMSEGMHNDTRYVKNKGYKSVLVGVIRINGSPVYYHILTSTYGYNATKDYEYVNGALYMTFERKIKIGAINASNIFLSKSYNDVSFRATFKWYQDCLNFQQHDYSDGSHWEETYAWISSNTPWTTPISLYFPQLPGVSYSDEIRGNTLEEKYSNWSAVCSDIFNAPSGVFPILSYTANEDHFDKELYRDTAYVEKWGTPELWA